jgi:peptidyl-prolyl cis-trans isomerase B (cyclophilin B)
MEGFCDMALCVRFQSPATLIKCFLKNYFDGTVFHRIIDNFMIQTGGYKVEDNTLMELPKTESIEGEFASNGHPENDLKHELGVISMARTSDPNSATGQFFICAASTPHLDGNYAAFGKTVDVESENIVLDLSKVETGNIGYGFTDFPLTPVVIKSIRRK